MQTTNTEDEVRVSTAGLVRTLMLNRPESLNGFTPALHSALMAKLEAAAADETIRCVVITGAGKAFCAGQDLKDPAVLPGENLGNVIHRWYRPLVQRLRSMPVPVVASVNGVAAGAGANLAFNCDLVIAAKSAAFMQPFAKIGLVPDTGGTWLLPRLVGRSRALGLAWLGDKLSAGEAERIGLVWQCVEAADLAGHTQALASRLAVLPTQALVATRAAFDAAQCMSLDDALANEARLQSSLGAAHDYREGVEAFLAKRAPQFMDR